MQTAKRSAISGAASHGNQRCASRHATLAATNATACHLAPLPARTSALAMPR